MRIHIPSNIDVALLMNVCYHLWEGGGGAFTLHQNRELELDNSNVGHVRAMAPSSA